MTPTTPAPAPAPVAAAPAVARPAIKIQWATVYVNDQDKALHFYTDVLGFQKKADISKGGYRWLTVTSGDDPGGSEHLLEASTMPATMAYQEALYGQQMPALQFLVTDVKAEYDRLVALGVKFTLPVTPVTGSIIAVLDDTCGNLVQLVQLTGH
jgi:predicted enzyme related to lactoylglutathione lyase